MLAERLCRLVIAPAARRAAHRPAPGWPGRYQGRRRPIPSRGREWRGGGGVPRPAGRPASQAAAVGPRPAPMPPQTHRAAPSPLPQVSTRP